MMKSKTGAVVIVGLVYFVAGIVFGALAGGAGSHQGVVAWRLAAWIASVIAFVAHILYEHVVLASPPTLSASRVASAAALGAFGLATAANIHSLMVPPPQYASLLRLSLVIWPIITGVPAFLVALVAAVLLSRVWPSRQTG